MRYLLPLLAAIGLLAADSPPQTGGPDPIPATGPGSKALRVFVRSGPKSHGPGDHDHPSFLRDWVPLLNARGAMAKGGDIFPTAAELAETDVVIIHRQVGGNFKPAERELIDAYAKRGGGFVVIHAGAVASQTGKPDIDDPATEYYRDLIGGTWRNKVTKWREGPMQLNFVDKEHPITKGIADFGMKDEIYYDLEMLPGVHALATAPTPKKKADGFEAQTQLWTYEKPGAQRAFVFIPGHTYVNFARPDVQTLLLRGIAWAGKKPIDTLSAR
jgi:type 1 glutamine amidotransferase